MARHSCQAIAVGSENTLCIVCLLYLTYVYQELHYLYSLCTRKQSHNPCSYRDCVNIKLIFISVKK